MTRLHPLLSIAAVLVSLVALTLAVSEGSAAPAPASPGGSAAPSQRPPWVAALEEELASVRGELARLDRLEAEVALLRRSPSGARTAADPRAARDAPERDDGGGETAERLNALERALARLERERAAPTADAARTRAAGTERPSDRSAADDPRLVFDLQLAAMDSTLDGRERLAALRELRHARDPYGDDARSPDVVAAMVELFETSGDAHVRADVFRQLSGVADPILRDPLLRALADDPSAEVREEAAETLGDFLPDPLIEAALAHAADHDPDRKVRSEAEDQLDGGE